MPRYEYRCETNDRTVEVSHAMGERLGTWGQVCERAGIDRGTTPADAPVEKVISVGLVGSGKAAGPDAPPARPCGPSCGCHPH